MTTANKVRLYDLAKELKLDTKRLIEEVRREGVDVSVPSNSVSKELPDKIRNKYFPKKETAAKRGVRVVKRAERAVEEPPPSETLEAAPEPEPEFSTPSPQPEAPVPPTSAGVPKRPTTARLVKKLAPAARAEQPEPETESPSAEIVEAPLEIEDAHSSFAESGSSEANGAPSGAPVISPASIPPPSRQVRVLRPTVAALNAGIRPGERAPSPVVPPSVTPKERVDRAGTRVRERTPLARTERLGTPGETATPQTTYIPPPDA